MSVGMKASWDAATTMFERAPIVTAKMPMIVDRHAVRNVCVATKKHGPAPPGRRPRAETPAETRIDPNRDSRGEAKSDSPHDAGRRRQHNKARIGDKQPPPDAPRIVIGNVNHTRIDRHNIDHAGVYNYTLLRRRNQHVRLLRLQPHGLDSVHDVSGLVVIGVAQLRRPGGVLREIVEDGGKRREAFDGRVPIHGVRPGRTLIRGQSHVLVQPGIRRGNLVRIRGTSQYLSDQRVRIESNRGHELIQLHRVQLDVRRRGRLRVQIQLCCRNQQQRKHERHHLAHGLIQENCALGVHRLCPFGPTAPTIGYILASNPSSVLNLNRNFLLDPKNGCYSPLNPCSRQCEIIFIRIAPWKSTLKLRIKRELKRLILFLTHRIEITPDPEGC